MGKKNCSKKRDKQNLRKRQENLTAVFAQEDFTEEFSWYREVMETEQEDLKEVQDQDKVK